MPGRAKSPRLMRASNPDSWVHTQCFDGGSLGIDPHPETNMEAQKDKQRVLSSEKRRGPTEAKLLGVQLHPSQTSGSRSKVVVDADSRWNLQ